MKAILEFKLPEEKFEHHQAVNAWRYAECLKDIWNQFRELEKYDERKSISTAEARQMVINKFNVNDVNVDDL